MSSGAAISEEAVAARQAELERCLADPKGPSAESENGGVSSGHAAGAEERTDVRAVALAAASAIIAATPVVSFGEPASPTVIVAQPPSPARAAHDVGPSGSGRSTEAVLPPPGPLPAAVAEKRPVEVPSTVIVLDEPSPEAVPQRPTSPTTDGRSAPVLLPSAAGGASGPDSNVPAAPTQGETGSTSTLAPETSGPTVGTRPVLELAVVPPPSGAPTEKRHIFRSLRKGLRAAEKDYQEFISPAVQALTALCAEKNRAIDRLEAEKAQMAVQLAAAQLLTAGAVPGHAAMEERVRAVEASAAAAEQEKARLEAELGELRRASALEKGRLESELADSRRSVASLGTSLAHAEQAAADQQAEVSKISKAMSEQLTKAKEELVSSHRTIDDLRMNLRKEVELKNVMGNAISRLLDDLQVPRANTLIKRFTSAAATVHGRARLLVRQAITRLFAMFSAHYEDLDFETLVGGWALGQTEEQMRDAEEKMAKFGQEMTTTVLSDMGM